MTKLFGQSWKKFTVFLMTGMGIITKDFWDLSPEQVEALMVLAGTFFVGQGMADWGKGAELVKNGNGHK